MTPAPGDEGDGEGLGESDGEGLGSVNASASGDAAFGEIEDPVLFRARALRDLYPPPLCIDRYHPRTNGGSLGPRRAFARCFSTNVSTSASVKTKDADRLAQLLLGRSEVCNYGLLTVCEEKPITRPNTGVSGVTLGNRDNVETPHSRILCRSDTTTIASHFSSSSISSSKKTKTRTPSFR